MNRKVLSTATKELNKAKAPAKPKDIFFDPSGMGMLNPNYAGKPVRLATDTLYNPTKYKIRAYADNGVSAKLNPYDTTDVTLEGAKYIEEYPEMQDGGIYMDGDLSQEEIDYYAKGGYIIEDVSVPQLTQAQKGKTVKPLEISDPKEFKYRNKMYADSLNLYKENAKWQPIRDAEIKKAVDWAINKNTIKKENVNKIITDNKSKTIKIPTTSYIPLQNDKTLTEANVWNKVNKKIKPTNVGRVYASDKNGNVLVDKNKTPFIFEYPVYKKPMQPVVFKETPANETVNNAPDPNRKVIGENSITQLDVNGKPVTTIEYVYEDQVPAKQPTVPTQSTVQPKPVMPDKGTAYRTQTVMYPDGTYELRQVPYWKSGEHNAQTGSKHLNPPGVINAADLSPEELQTLKNKNKLNSKKEGGALLTKKVTCKKCGWKWDAADGGDDITTCHKCGGQGLVHAQNGMTKLSTEDEQKFQKFYHTLPDNLMQDDPEYDIRGYWDSEGRPSEFNYDQPKQDDGYYHAYSINSNTGEYLKAPTHPTFQHAIDEDRKMGYRPITNVYGRNIATENPSLIEPEAQSFLKNMVGPVVFKQGGQGLIHAQKGVQVNKKGTRNPALEKYMNRDMSQAYQIKDVPSETIQATANQKPKLSQNVNSKKDILGDIQKEKEAFAIRQSKDQIKEGTGPREAQPISEKLRDIVFNPITAAGHWMRGQDVPDYLQESLDNGTYGYWSNGTWHTERNPLDIATDLSPIGLLHDANDTYDGIKNKDINQVGAGLLGFIPGFGEVKKAKKVINSVNDELLDAYNLAIDLKRQGKISHLPDSPEGFDTWLQSQYNQKPIYRVVDVNKNVVNDQLIKNNMIKQGLDPNNEYHIAEYMGTSIAPAEVINRGRRSGGHDELLKGTNKDILYFAEDPTWIGPRYGGDNPYYIKTFADETPTGYKNQVLGLRPTSRIKKNYTRNYPGFDINQVPSGVLFEDKMLSVGPNSITPIIGDKGTKVRKVANIVKGSDFDRLPNKRFNNGGIISKLSKKEIQELVEQGYVIEEQ